MSSTATTPDDDDSMETDDATGIKRVSSFVQFYMNLDSSFHFDGAILHESGFKFYFTLV